MSPEASGPRPSRLVPIVCILIGLGAAALVYPLRRPSPASPSAALALGDWDLGLLRERTAVRTLELRNDGAATWTVREANAACACLTLVPRSPTVAPGETLFVDLRFEPGPRRGPMSLRYWIRFEGEPGLALGELRADVWLGPYLEPNTIEVLVPGNASEFRVETALWTLEQAGVQPVAPSGDAHLSVSIGAPTSEGGRSWWPVTIRGTVPETRGDLRLLQPISADAGKDLLPLTIVVRRPAVLRSSPSAAVLAAGRSGTLLRLELWKGRAPAPRVARAEVRASGTDLLPNLQAAWRNGVLELTSEAPLSAGHADVHVLTEDGEELLVPVHVLDPGPLE